MSSPMPKGWVEHRQGDIVEISNGRAYKLTEWEKQGTPVIRLQNLTGSGKDYYYSNLELPEHQYCNFGDLLYMWSATFGAHIWSGQKAIYHYHIWKITCDEINITKHYLYHLLGQKTAEWMNQSNGMGILHVTKRSMEEMALTLPPIQEQKKIASILTAVDDVIESTQAQINKLKDLKTGMMQELLTKGIGHTEFKDSPVGRIPRAWNVVQLGEVVHSMDGGVSVNGENRPKRGNEFGVLKVSAVSNGKFRPNENKAILAVDLHRAKLHPQAGHILFSRANTPELVGECGYVEETRKDLFLPDKLWILQLKASMRIDARWLSYVLSSGQTRERISEAGTGTSGSMKNISKPNLLSIKIGLPPEIEQRKISNLLVSIDRRIEHIIRKLERSNNLKKALMQDLLTGKVRVKVNPQ